MMYPYTCYIRSSLVEIQALMMTPLCHITPSTQYRRSRLGTWSVHFIWATKFIIFSFCYKIYCYSTHEFTYFCLSSKTEMCAFWVSGIWCGRTYDSIPKRRWTCFCAWEKRTYRQAVDKKTYVFTYTLLGSVGMLLKRNERTQITT